MAIEWVDRDFDTKVESICHLAASIALPPDQEDLSALTIQLLLETKTVVNKKGEMSVSQCLPDVRAALSCLVMPLSSLYEPLLPVLSKPKPKLPPLVGHKQHESMSVIISASTTNVAAHLAMKLGARSSASVEVVSKSSVSLPFHSELRSPVNMPPICVEMPSTMQ